jgi:predicted phage terminase large subunit-like protein
MAPFLVPDFVMGKHIEVMCQKLQEVADGTLKRVMIFLPPRSTKSLVGNQLYSSWYMGNNPERFLLGVSHSADLAVDFGRTVRDIMSLEEYGEIFPGATLRADVRAQGKFMTEKGGTYFAAGRTTQIAGRGAHVAILDDVLSEKEAEKAAGREHAKKWYTSGLRSRLQPNGAIVIINTRYHDDDICGWLLGKSKEGEWEVIKFPAWNDEVSAKLLGHPVGTSYFPEWKPDHLLKAEEEEITRNEGTATWQSLYMQDPQPQGGGMLKDSYFKVWEEEEPPDCSFVLQSMDTAFSIRTTADYSVMQTWGIFEILEKDSAGVETYVPNMILLSNVRDRYEYPDLRAKAQELFHKHKPDLVLIEKKASGQSLIQDLRRGGLPILEYLPGGDKVTRAHACTPVMEAGRVWLPAKTWSDTLLTEAMAFPKGKHDDQIDAMTQAILWMKESWNLQHPDDEEYPEVKYKPVSYWRV